MLKFQPEIWGPACSSPAKYGPKYKFQIMLKIKILVQNVNYGQQIKIMAKNQNSGEKFKFCLKIKIVVKNPNSGKKYKFW